MSYLGLLRVVGQPDSTSGYAFNPFLPATGWDVLVNQSIAAQSAVCISGTWPRLTAFEVFQVHLDGPVGASCLVMINRQPWNHVLQGWQNYNDPQQAMQLTDGDEVEFAWTVAATSPPFTPSGGANVQPVVTMWLRAEIPLFQ